MSSSSPSSGQVRQQIYFKDGGQASLEYLIAVLGLVITAGLAFQGFIGALRGYYSLLSFFVGLPIP